MSVTFYIVYTCLNWLCQITGLSYEELNVIIWYVGVPLIYCLLLDKIIRKPILSPTFVLFTVVFYLSLASPSQFADKLFIESVDFLLSFSRIGIDYDLASVLICVWLPLLVFAVLFSIAFPPWCRRHVPSISKFVPWLKPAT